MLAFVYKSLRKPETYLYLAERDAFEQVPEPVRLPLGELVFVLEVELHDGRRLARADVDVVRRNLSSQRFHLQQPPSVLDPLVAGGVGDG